MTDHVAILREKIEKAEAKVQRYRKSLETADSDLSDLVTALRVIEGITNDSDSNGGGTSTTMGRQLDIVRLLGVGRTKGQPPADLYASYCLLGSEDIKIDTFRTTIWRMKDGEFEVDGGLYAVHSDNGHYWKEEAEKPQIIPPPQWEQQRSIPPWEQPHPEQKWKDDEEPPF